jgi:hypothetical protein
MLITAVVGTGLYGYYVDDPAARRDALTGVEAVSVGKLPSGGLIRGHAHSSRTTQAAG